MGDWTKRFGLKGKHALVTGWYDNHVYLVGFEGTGGDPTAARAKIEGWIHRPRHD